MPVARPIGDNEAAARFHEILNQGVKPEVQEEQDPTPSEQEPDGSSDDQGLLEPEAASEEPETPEEQEEPETKEEEEAPEVSNLQELIESLNLDPEKVYSLKVAMSDGIEPLTLGQLKDTYQEYSRTADRQKELDSERQKFLGWKAEQEKQYQQATTIAKGVLEQLNNDLQAEMQGVDWKELREQDPAEFAAKVTEYQSKQAGLQQRYQQIIAADQQHQQQIQQEQQKWYQEHLRKGKEELLKRIPEWKDPSIKKAEHEEIFSLASEYGYTPQELAGVADPRILVMWNDLRKAKALLGKGEKAAKVVKGLPKMRSPGAPSKNQAAQSKLVSLERKAKTGTEADKAAYINALLASRK